MVFLLNHLQAQSIKTDSIELGPLLYGVGIDSFKVGNYLFADSIFTEVLCSYQNQNVYFNRGITRLFLQDTIAFCADLDIAANKYFDLRSTELFNKFCCIQIDTLRLNKKFEVTSDTKYAYFEIIKALNYEPLVMGTIHDAEKKTLVSINDFLCDSSDPIVKSRITDVIAKYILRDRIKYFYETPQPILIKNLRAYQKFMRKIENELTDNYDYIKSKNEIDKIEIIYEFKVTTSGKVIQPKIVETFPSLIFFEDEMMLNKALVKLMKDHPVFVPASVGKYKVNYIDQHSIIY